MEAVVAARTLHERVTSLCAQLRVLDANGDAHNLRVAKLVAIAEAVRLAGHGACAASRRVLMTLERADRRVAGDRSDADRSCHT